MRNCVFSYAIQKGRHHFYEGYFVYVTEMPLRMICACTCLFISSVIYIHIYIFFYPVSKIEREVRYDLNHVTYDTLLPCSALKKTVPFFG